MGDLDNGGANGPKRSAGAWGRLLGIRPLVEQEALKDGRPVLPANEELDFLLRLLIWFGRVILG
jgi:hypothetical protein